MAVNKIKYHCLFSFKDCDQYEFICHGLESVYDQNFQCFTGDDRPIVIANDKRDLDKPLLRFGFRTKQASRNFKWYLLRKMALIIGWTDEHQMNYREVLNMIGDKIGIDRLPTNDPINSYLPNFILEKLPKVSIRKVVLDKIVKSKKRGL